MILTAEEERVLGCLIEKEMTTPEYYPLSLNALVSACNQKTNREPVMSIDERDVTSALEVLRHEGLVLRSAEGQRVAKYAHHLGTKLSLDHAELAAIALLLLRGPQTAGELRGRSERMHPFADLAEIEGVLQRLSDRVPSLVMRLDRQPGHKEHRFMHLFGGPPQVEGSELPPTPARESAFTDSPHDRLAHLEGEVSTLKIELEELKQALRDLKAQFD